MQMDADRQGFGSQYVERAPAWGGDDDMGGGELQQTLSQESGKRKADAVDEGYAEGGGWTGGGETEEKDVEMVQVKREGDGDGWR